MEQKPLEPFDLEAWRAKHYSKAEIAKRYHGHVLGISAAILDLTDVKNDLESISDHEGDDGLPASELEEAITKLGVALARTAIWAEDYKKEADGAEQ